MKAIAVVPCYNEEQNIADVVSRAKKYCRRVVVIDNMSTDRTREEAERQTPCYNVYTCYLKGAGVATAYGLAYSLNPMSHLRGDVIVTLDGDGQHNPDDIPKLLKPIADGEADIVVGTRFAGKGRSVVPLYRRFGIKVITWLYNMGSGQKLSDTQCCFRAFSRDVISKVSITEAGFSFSVEMLIKARKMGFRIREVPVGVIYHRRFSQNSSLNLVVHGLGVAFGVIKWKIKVELLGGS